MVAASWIGGFAGLVRGALTRLRHKGGAGALGETDRDIQDAEPARAMAQTAAGALNPDVPSRSWASVDF